MTQFTSVFLAYRDTQTFNKLSAPKMTKIGQNNPFPIAVYLYLLATGGLLVLLANSYTPASYIHMNISTLICLLPLIVFI